MNNKVIDNIVIGETIGSLTWKQASEILDMITKINKGWHIR